MSLANQTGAQKTTESLISEDPKDEEEINTSTKRFNMPPNMPEGMPQKRAKNALVSASTMFHTRDAEAASSPVAKSIKQTLSRLIETFKNNQDLTNLIERFNMDPDAWGFPRFDYKDQKVRMTKDDLDKFVYIAVSMKQDATNSAGQSLKKLNVRKGSMQL